MQTGLAKQFATNLAFCEELMMFYVPQKQATLEGGLLVKPSSSIFSYHNPLTSKHRTNPIPTSA